MRSIALDVHRDFCEVALKEGGELRSGGRIRTSVAELELFAQSLARDDRVALEATGPANAIADILAPHVARVVVANTRRVRAIAEAKVKSDKVDAATLCELLDAGFLPAVWSPDEQTRVLRGLLGRRDRLVRSRTGRRTPSTRRSGASSRVARRCRISSGARGAPGSGDSSCRHTSARSSTAASGRSTSTPRRSRCSSQSWPGSRSHRSRSSG